MVDNVAPSLGVNSTFAIVRSILSNHQLDLSPEGEAFVARHCSGSITLGADGFSIETPTEVEPKQDLEAFLLKLLNHIGTRKYFVASRATARPSEAANPFPVNPFTHEHRNITRQMMIEQQDPTLAKRLREEAAKADARSGGDPCNPFSKAGWNLTAQMKLIKSNPEHARQLEANANA